MVPRSASRLHGTLLDTVINAPLSFFTSTDAGKTINRFSQDMNLIDMELPMAFIQFSFASLMSVMQAILMCLSAAYFAATIPFVLLVLYVLQAFYLRTSRQVRLMDLEAKSPLYSNFVESLSGLITTRAFGWTEDLKARNLELLDASQKPFYLLYCIQRWLSLVLDLVVAGLSVVLMVLVVKLRGKIDPGFVGLALVNVMGFNTTLTQVIRYWTALETSLGAISRLKSFAASTTSENLSHENGSIPQGWPSHGGIEFSHLSAGYTPTAAAVIRNISLQIPASQKIGICGRSGSGKSSLITSLFRMLEITSGTITIDGIDLSTLPRQVIRTALNAIPQDPFFIRGTVRQNVDPTGHTTDAKIQSTLRKVGLFSIVADHGGVDVPMDAEDWFSHGQRQLFCLARATLNPAKIVILDEATSSVDVQTDALMQRIIREEFQGCTIIAVAHRLQTILDFDRVVVLSAGEIVEYGVPGELLGTEGSKFRELWEA